MTVYDYDREFRLKILALCLDDAWMARYGDAIIRAEYFERDDEIAFAKAVLEYRQKYGKSPYDPNDTIAICNGNNATFILDMYEVFEEGNLELAGDVAVTFAREQAAKIAILESVDDVRAGRMQKAIDRMKEALKVGQDLLNLGLDPIRDINLWLYDYWAEKSRTGWPHIDRILQGGLNPGELGIILGPSNAGKSMALINIGYSLVSIGSGRNIVHFTHEMSKEQVAKRYAARMIFRFPSPDDDLEEYAESVMEAARKLVIGQIRVIDGKKSTAQLEAHLEQLDGEGFEVEAVIDDYLDLVTPPRNYTERRFELTATYEWARELARVRQIPFWTASQSGRDSMSKEIVTMKDIAEDIGKANTADVIVALCQTRDEEEAEQCRLFMAKVRDGVNKAMVTAKYYKKQQAIVSTGYATGKKDELSV